MTELLTKRRFSRRAFLRALAGLAAIGVGGSSYAVGVEPMLRLKTARYDAAPPGWPIDMRLRIVAIADPHVGEPFMSLDRLAEIVERANALSPDVIVLLGDYVATHLFITRRASEADIAGVLAGLRAPLGRWAVMGNHDWWDDEDAQARGVGPTRMHRAFEAAGLPVLENQAVRLDADGRPFWMVGLGDQWAFGRFRRHGVDDLPGALAQIDDDAPAILLAHEPDIFPKTPDRVSLTLSGHTHGGQVRLGPWAPIVPSRYGSRYAYGHIVENGRHLVVSAGLGCSVAPVRFGAPPEITVVDLGAPRDAGPAVG